ncbi:MAG: acetolactate synthase small subunit [Acidimicrobiia bacterium]|nr:acetolactate synthase small subunit [Acidimicrobiia bacterium]
MEPHLTTLSVLVENQPGVLARVAGLIARRGYNIESLAVGPTDDPGFSRMTLVVDQTQTHVEQIVKQLYKLINVIKIIELDPTDSIERELLLVRVACTAETRFQVLELAEIFEAKVADVGAESVALELSGPPSRLNDLLELVEQHGIKEVARTGRIGLERARKRAAI